MSKYLTFSIVSVLLLGTVFAVPLRVTANPRQRSYACMISDSLHRRAILFGGGNYRQPSGDYLNDVWTLDFDDETWKLLVPQGPSSSVSPSSRVMAAAAYNPAGNEMIMFGGMYGGWTYYNDVWILDLTPGSEQWIQIIPAGTPPSPRNSATAIIDPINNRFIIFGGDSATYYRNDTWALDLNTFTWSLLNPSGTLPPVRFEHSAIYDPSGHRMIIFGGKSASAFNDVWALDLSCGSEHWEQIYPGGNQPNPRGRHFCVYSDMNTTMTIGFGYSSAMGFYNDLWELNLTTLNWQQIFTSGVTVASRRGSCAAYDPFHHQIFIFGGDQYPDHYFGDTYVLTLDTLDMKEHSVEENSRDHMPVSSHIAISPNPLTIPCRINIFVPFPGNVSLKVIDVSGRFINTLVQNRRHSGNYAVEWSGKDSNGKRVAAGTYFICLEIDGKTIAKKVILVE